MQRNIRVGYTPGVLTGKLLLLLINNPFAFNLIFFLNKRINQIPLELMEV